MRWPPAPVVHARSEGPDWVHATAELANVAAWQRRRSVIQRHSRRGRSGKNEMQIKADEMRP